MAKVTNHFLMDAIDKIIAKEMAALGLEQWMTDESKTVLASLKVVESNHKPRIFNELDKLLPSWRTTHITSATDPEKYVYGQKLIYRINRAFKN